MPFTISNIQYPYIAAVERRDRHAIRCLWSTEGSPYRRQLASGANPHYQIHIVDDTTHYRIAVNVTSQLAPSELEFLVDSRFDHPFLAELVDKPLGWLPLQSRPGGVALDFIRSNLFDPRDMRVLPLSAPGLITT